MRTNPGPALVLALLPLVGACIPDYGYIEKVRTDVFQQNLRREIDLLVVVDNSGSMVQEQDNLGRNFETLIDTFADADVSWQIAVTSTDTEPDGEYRGLLVGGDDEIIMRGPYGEIDRVGYDRDWGFQPGVALQLDPGSWSFTGNDAPSAWCAASGEYADDSLGSPGALNPGCDGSDPPEPGEGEDQGPRSPRSGELLVTEIMAMSPAVDSQCEWLELTSLEPDTLDLTGVTLADDGRNLYTFPDGTLVEPWGTVVVARALEDNCDVPADVATGDDLVLNDDVQVIDASTADGDDLFAENVALGTQGTGIEMGLHGAWLALEECWYDIDDPDATDPCVSGDEEAVLPECCELLRPEAALSILFVSDEDDNSPQSVGWYLRHVQGLKGDEGFREPGLVNLSAVVGKDVPPRDDLPSCESDNGVAWYGRRYIEAANETQGLVESICEEDFAPIVERLGLTLSGLVVDFALSDVPQLETLEVALYDDENDDSKVRDLERGADFTYVSEGNYLHFDEDQVPAAGQYVVARYEVLPTGSDQEDGEVTP